ncbi:PH (Pleckstrin Homology) domain-containing protein [Haloactinospora alba]|uniref:PH (Pleckstrin Homology) domain-containing protein n=1 Tax=Haloactinospora alba TaxID=405555 RepID=A0A543NMB1_9ACTN|nr:PH domain-containing protein [Haloactinospora alba]TQN32944.1 PH (Pleckstrin Homology) domain-containing protein [Haloactinospora alba]
MRPITAPLSRFLGWAWVVLAALLLVDLALNGAGRQSLVAGAVVLLTVGGAYVLWLRPRVVPALSGVRLVNPLRETFVPWPAFTWADVTDVLRVHAGERVFRSWPLRETKRARVRQNLRRANGYADAPDEDPSRMRPAELAAKQLRDEAERCRARPGAGGGSDTEEPVTSWSPDALAALGIPVVLLLAALLLG